MKPPARIITISWNYNRAEIVADGVVHAVGAALAIAGATVLLAIAFRSAPGAEIASVVVYVVGLLSMLGLSMAYNLWPVSPRKWLLRRFDHSSIYLLIAGTYTPFIWQMESGIVPTALFTFVWLIAFGVPYAFLLAILVALLDLVPVVGSTIAGIIVAAVAFTVSLPVCLATIAFFVVYRFAEDYFLVPRIIGKAVQVPALVTVVAVLIGAALLGIIGALVAGLVGTCVVRFRAGKRPEVPVQTHGHRTLEIVWTALPLAIVIGLMVLTAGAMAASDPTTSRPPDIVVIGHQWWWEARYASGAVTANEIHVPVGKDVLVRVESNDVIHDFWVPQLGRKVDAVPGYTTYTWFKGLHTGNFRGQCAQLCGTNHAAMIAYVKIVTPAQYAAWAKTEEQDITTANSQVTQLRQILTQQHNLGS